MGLSALKVFKKGDVCSDDTTLFGYEDLSSVLLSFLYKWCFLNVQISWNWNYVRENLEEGTEEMFFLVSDLHSHDVSSCTKNRDILTTVLLGSILFSAIPAPESLPNSAALQLTFWECGLNG